MDLNIAFSFKLFFNTDYTTNALKKYLMSLFVQNLEKSSYNYRMFKIFRIYDFIKDDESNDFYGVFIDRLYPRGIKKEIFSSFLWLKSVTPSNELRKWFHEDKEARFSEFRLKFKTELTTVEAREGIKQLLNLAKTHGKIALLTAAKDINLSHAPIILEALNAR